MIDINSGAYAASVCDWVFNAYVNKCDSHVLVFNKILNAFYCLGIPYEVTDGPPFFRKCDLCMIKAAEDLYRAIGEDRDLRI